MHILVVEDDPDQAELIQGTLADAFPQDRIDLIRTEQEFRARLDEIEGQPPDVVVMDVMLRWTDPSPTMEPRPEDVKSGGIFKAGIRCKHLLASRERTKEIPVILYTVLERGDLESKDDAAMHLSKEAEPEALIHAIRSFTRRSR